MQKQREFYLDIVTSRCLALYIHNVLVCFMKYYEACQFIVLALCQVWIVTFRAPLGAALSPGWVLNESARVGYQRQPSYLPLVNLLKYLKELCSSAVMNVFVSKTIVVPPTFIVLYQM